ncbi:MAG: hypothetical protein HN353_01780 [Bdellovibrionales bacterium]|jgi:hypothetical protein|nr:hypothetical protein [Bdellovibrionales bacterium]MBT3525389.1 hypothetical protein [Bdellovibrionales bacterium]MBT7669025.1 hypothetical protein [Bdellovibrionales bacterium]MBT7765999.1 hypothetical protein [Bdellovibrionales bacterium]
MIWRLAVVLQLLLLLTGQELFSSTEAESVEMSKRWQKLYRLVNHEVRTIKQVKKIGPGLRYRLLELYSEKMTLIKKRENRRFLLAPPRGLVAKQRFFAHSRSLYYRAKRHGLDILKDYPNYQLKSNIYYTLALNARDFGKNKVTRIYLQRAIKYSKPGEDIYYQAMVSLAEHYYNTKKYQLAVALYKFVLQNKEDEWLTKHLYNYGWCLFKLKNYDLGLEQLVNSYQLAKQGRYINLSKQLLDGLATFFVYSKQSERGGQFFELEIVDATSYLVKMVKVAADLGHYPVITKLLAQSDRLLQQQKKINLEGQIQLWQMKMVIYRQFAKRQLLFLTAQEVAKLSLEHKITADSLGPIIEQIKEFVGFMQVELIKDVRKSDRRYSKDSLARIMAYFDILAQVDRKNIARYRYYQGESALSVGRYTASANLYMEAVDLIKVEKKNLDYRQKCIDSLMALIDRHRIPAKLMRKVKLFAFGNYLLFWPKGELAAKISIRIFDLYLAQGDDVNSLIVLDNFAKNWSTERESQRSLAVRLIDHYVGKRSADNLALITMRLTKGYLGFKRKYIEETVTILSSLLFENNQKLEQAGDVKGAVAGYLTLFKNKKYPARIRAKSALKMAVMESRLGNDKGSYHWMNRSLPLFTSAEIIEQVDVYYQLAVRYNLLQNFGNATKLGNNLLGRLCTPPVAVRKLRKKFFQLVLLTGHVNKKGDFDLSKLMQQGGQCGLAKSYLHSQQNIFLKQEIEFAKLNQLLVLLKEHGDNKKLRTYFFERLMAAFLIDGGAKGKRASLIIPALLRIAATGSADDQKLVKGALALDLLAQDIAKFKTVQYKMEKFAMDGFNHYLKERFVSLNDLQKRAAAISATGDATVTYLAYSYILDGFDTLSVELLTFSPPIKDSDFQKEFKKQMKSLERNNRRKRERVAKSVAKLRRQGEVLVDFKTFAAPESNQELKANSSYPLIKSVVLADR